MFAQLTKAPGMKPSFFSLGYGLKRSLPLFVLIAAVLLSEPVRANDVECLQQNLAKLGYKVGRAGGQIGKNTRSASEAFNDVLTIKLPELSEKTASAWCDKSADAAAVSATGSRVYDSKERWDWNGYKPIEEIDLPYRDIAESTVVKIYTVTLLEKDLNSYEVIDTDSTKKVTNTTKLDSDLRVLQIETCRNQGLKRCPIFKTPFNGTGFIDRGRQIYTCRHMVHNWITIAAKENNLLPNQISPAVRFVDFNKVTVYNSTTSGNLIKITSMNEDPRLRYVLKETQDPVNSPFDRLYMQSEFLKMDSSVDLIEPVSLTFSDLIRAEDRVYFSGFPAKTKMFGGKEGDTPGFRLVSSTGPVTYTSTDYQLFITNAIVTNGMSGGMVTDESGTVVGIACTSDNDGDDGSKKNSTSVIFNQDAQVKLWNMLSQLEL